MWHIVVFHNLSFSLSSLSCCPKLYLSIVHPFTECSKTSSLSSLSLWRRHQEQEFLQKQQLELDGALKKIIQQHKVEIATMEKDCLNHKQQLLRGTGL